jgi:hypothetical protein
MVARMDTLLRKETVKAFAFGVGLLALFVGAATPLCIWLASADSCERMVCELLVMRRPMADVSYCEAWFDLFR